MLVLGVTCMASWVTAVDLDWVLIHKIQFYGMLKFISIHNRSKIIRQSVPNCGNVMEWQIRSVFSSRSESLYMVNPASDGVVVIKCKVLIERFWKTVSLTIMSKK